MNRHLHQFPQSERNLVPSQEVSRLLHDSLSEWIHKPNIINKWIDIASKKLGKDIEANDLLTIYKEGWIKDALDPFKQSEIWTYQNEIMRGMKTAENSVAIYLHANFDTLKQNKRSEITETQKTSTETMQPSTEHWKEISKPPSQEISDQEKSEGREVPEKSRKETTTAPSTSETHPSALDHWKKIAEKTAHHEWTQQKSGVPVESTPPHEHAATAHKRKGWKAKQTKKVSEESSKTEQRETKPDDITPEKLSDIQNQKPSLQHVHQEQVEKAPAKGETSKATPEKSIEEHPGTGIKGREGEKANEENLNVPAESQQPQTQTDFPSSSSQPQQETVTSHPSDISKEPSKQPDDLRTKEATHFENEPPLDLNRERLQPSDLTRAREQASSDVRDLLERQETPSTLF